jgi:hypothetical protein
MRQSEIPQHREEMDLKEIGHDGVNELKWFRTGTSGRLLKARW